MTIARRAMCASAAGLLACLACACSPAPAGSAVPVLELVAEANEAIDYPIDANHFLDGRATVEARVPSGSAPFRVLAREPSLAQSPCARCHTIPLDRLRRRVGEAARAHWSVTLTHASSDVMTCGTCHATDDVSALTLLGGRRLSVDHAYEVCGQCHSGQAADWVGGAHGKRAGGWTPPRVTFNCTECHNPHAPALEPRWPARAGRAP